MKATRKEAVVEVVEPTKIVLELTELEANTLGAILGNINRDMVKEFVKIHDKLIVRVGVEEVHSRFQFDLYDALCRACNP
jgi:hypothetical protein